jgi:transaldolase
MTGNYFQRVFNETPTRLWINNPNGQDLEKAIAVGAINCTTNPQYCQKLFESDPEYIRSVVDSVVREVEDDEEAAEKIYHKATHRVIARFRSIYEASGGTQGYVTMQGDPRKDDDVDTIVNEAIRGAKLGPNFMAKIPVIESGAAAIEALVKRNVPICATEIFTLSQAINICEKYAQAAKKSGNNPPFFVTHINGIFDEYLTLHAKAINADISPDILSQAACIVTRAQYRMMKTRNYPGTMLGGGARSIKHFTEMVGGNVHVTINWKEIDILQREDRPIENRMNHLDPQDVIDELNEKLPDFRRALLEDGLYPIEFKDFGALHRFRNSFIGGWKRLLEEVRDRRSVVNSEIVTA